MVVIGVPVHRALVARGFRGRPSLWVIFPKILCGVLAYGGSAKIQSHCERARGIVLHRVASRCIASPRGFPSRRIAPRHAGYFLSRYRTKMASLDSTRCDSTYALVSDTFGERDVARPIVVPAFGRRSRADETRRLDNDAR